MHYALLCSLLTWAFEQYILHAFHCQRSTSIEHLFVHPFDIYSDHNNNNNHKHCSRSSLNILFCLQRKVALKIELNWNDAQLQEQNKNQTIQPIVRWHAFYWFYFYPFVHIGRYKLAGLPHLASSFNFLLVTKFISELCPSLPFILCMWISLFHYFRIKPYFLHTRDTEFLSIWFEW